MKSPIVSKCRNSAPTETPARLVISAADALAYPTSMIVAMLASSSRATVSSRRCRWVLAISGVDELPRGGRRQEATGLRGRPVAFAEFTGAEDDLAVHACGDHGRVVAIHHAAQASVERDLLLVVSVYRAVQAGGVDHHEVGAISLAQRAGVKPEPVGDLAGEPMDRVFDGHEPITLALGVEHALEQSQRVVVERHVPQMRAGVGEPHVDGRFDGELVELFGPVIGHRGRPADVALAVL